VRTEAARLRVRLEKYYDGDGRGDAVVIGLPKGGYVPVFLDAEPTVSPVALPVRPQRSFRKVLLPGAAALGVILAVLIWWWTSRTTTPVTIAVLPMENLTHD